MRGKFAGPALALAVLAPGAAGAAEVVFHSDPRAPEMAVVTQLYGESLRARPKARVETALVDLDGRGVGSIAVRFRDEGMCSRAGCYTVVLRHDGSVWQQVLERSTAKLETGARSAPPSGANVLELRVNGGETWTWTGLGRYQIRLESLGRVVDPTGMIEDARGRRLDPRGGPAPKAVAEAAAGALHKELGGRLPDAEPVRFWASPIEIAPNAPAYFVTAQAVDVCGAVIGCPSAVLAQVSGAWRPLAVLYAPGLAAVLPDKAPGLGYQDLAVGDRQGYVVLRHDGRAYKPVATSYPSALTPVP